MIENFGKSAFFQKLWFYTVFHKASRNKENYHDFTSYSIQHLAIRKTATSLWQPTSNIGKVGEMPRNFWLTNSEFLAWSSILLVMDWATKRLALMEGRFSSHTVTSLSTWPPPCKSVVTSRVLNKFSTSWSPLKSTLTFQSQ